MLGRVRKTSEVIEALTQCRGFDGNRHTLVAV
jgi:hypothetical protein